MLAGCSRDVAGNYSGNAVWADLAGSSRDLAGSRGQKQWRCILSWPRGILAGCRWISRAKTVSFQNSGVELAGCSRARGPLRGILAGSRGRELHGTDDSGIAQLGFLALFKAQHSSQSPIWAAYTESTLRKVFSILLKAQKQVLANIFFNHIKEIKSLEGVQDPKSVLRGFERWSSTETMNRGYEQDQDNH